MRVVPLLPLLCFAAPAFAWAPPRRCVVAPARRGAVALGAAPPAATPPERRGVVARLRVAGLFLRYYASPAALAALSIALAPRARAARRGSGAAPRDAALALWRGSKGGGGKVEARCAYFLDALGPWRRVRTFRSLAFDRAQREPGAAPYSYAAFHVACAACLAAPEATREVPAAAAADAFRDANPRGSLVTPSSETASAFSAARRAAIALGPPRVASPQKATTSASAGDAAGSGAEAKAR